MNSTGDHIMCMTKKLVVGKNEVEQLTYDSRLNRFKIMPVLNKKDHKYSIKLYRKYFKFSHPSF